MAYNLLILRKPAGIVLSLLFLAVLAVPSSAQQHPGPARVSRLLVIIPFENTSNAAGTDWISESFPEVLSTRLSPSGFFIMSRDDRLNAFDRLGIPPGAKPSRATLYQVGQQLDADYLIMGDYRIEGNITTHARVMDMERLRLSPEFTESGPLTNLISIQTALAWDILKTLNPGTLPKTVLSLSSLFRDQMFWRTMYAASQRPMIRKRSNTLKKPCAWSRRTLLPCCNWEKLLQGAGL